MEPIEEKQPFSINIGKLAIEPSFAVMRGIGLSVVIGEGVFWHSLRFELVLLPFVFGLHFVWDNPPGGR